MTERMIESILWLCGVAFLIPVVMFAALQVLRYITQPQVTKVKVTYEGICLPATDQPDETRMRHYDWSVVARIKDENKRNRRIANTN